MSERPPVIVSLIVEFPTGSKEDRHEVDRAEWDAMSPRERREYMDDVTEAFATNYVSWGWHIEDGDDLAGAEG